MDWLDLLGMTFALLGPAHGADRHPVLVACSSVATCHASRTPGTAQLRQLCGRSLLGPCLVDWISCGWCARRLEWCSWPSGRWSALSALRAMEHSRRLLWRWWQELKEGAHTAAAGAAAVVQLAGRAAAAWFWVKVRTSAPPRALLSGNVRGWGLLQADPLYLWPRTTARPAG